MLITTSMRCSGGAARCSIASKVVGVRRPKGKGVDHPIGLVHFMPREDATHMLAARDRLVVGAFAGVRDLANYSLHAFAVPTPDAMLQLQDDGTYTLLLPDHLDRRPTVGQEFTFNEKRTVGTEASTLWSGVQTFMADAFEILENAQLQREESAPADRLGLIRHLRTNWMPDKPRKRGRSR